MKIISNDFHENCRNFNPNFPSLNQNLTKFIFIQLEK